jgi:hypothetical protein
MHSHESHNQEQQENAACIAAMQFSFDERFQPWCRWVDNQGLTSASFAEISVVWA